MDGTTSSNWLADPSPNLPAHLDDPVVLDNAFGLSHEVHDVAPHQRETEYHDVYATVR